MNTRLWVAAPVLVIGGAIAGAMAFGLAGPAASAAQPQVQGQDTSTLDDQTELALTVYNSDLALVRDVRNVQLPRGTFDLRFMDIAATVNPADRPLPLADRAVARGCPRAELRVPTCSSPRSSCASTSAATSRSCASCRTAAPRGRKK